MKKRELRKLIKKQRARLKELVKLSYETYQVVGVLAEEAGRFDGEDVERVLDNLSVAYRVHKNVLPFESLPKDPP